AHHRFLDDDLALGAGEHAPADRGIFPFGIFTHDIEIYVARLAASQRRGHAGHEAHRPQVHILVELAAELKQRAPQRHVIRHRFRPADRTEEDGIVTTYL